MRSANLKRGRALSLTLAMTLAAGALMAVATPSQAAGGKLTLTPATGKGLSTIGGVAQTIANSTPSAIITVAGTGFTTAGGTSVIGGTSNAANTTTVGLGGSAVQFNTATTCPATAVLADGVTATNVLASGDSQATGTVPTYTVVNSTKLVVTVPSLLLTNSSGVWSSKAYSLCIYDNGYTANASPANATAVGTTLIGQATYTVYPQPTVSKVTPSQGSIVGGNSVTVDGVNFTGKSTASLNGVTLTNVKVAKDGKSLTGTVPATATIPKVVDKVDLGGSKYDLTVTTEGGPSTFTTLAANDDYTYVNSVTANPKLAAVAGGTTLTVTGKGFSTILSPTVGSPTTNARVLLIPGGAFNSTATVPGSYDWPWKSGSASGYPTGTGVGTLSDTFSCTNVKVISDVELTCKTPALVTGTYTVTLVDNFLLNRNPGTDTYYQTIPSSTATITVSAF
jgi:hypothetical protein